MCPSEVASQGGEELFCPHRAGWLPVWASPQWQSTYWALGSYASLHCKPTGCPLTRSRLCAEACFVLFWKHLSTLVNPCIAHKGPFLYFFLGLHFEKLAESTRSPGLFIVRQESCLGPGQPRSQLLVKVCDSNVFCQDWTKGLLRIPVISLFPGSMQELKRLLKVSCHGINSP